MRTDRTPRLALLSLVLLDLAALPACGSSSDSPPNINTDLFAANLIGSSEVPPVVTAATGTAQVEHDPLTSTIDVTIMITGIQIGNITGFHIHDGAAGVNGPVIVNLGMAGMVFQDIGGGTIQAVGTDIAFPPGSLTDLQTLGLYVNIHTTTNPGGEIRGQLIPTS